MTSTLGLDLASQPRSTAICGIEWRERQAVITALWRGRAGDGVTPLHDKMLVSALRGNWGGGLPGGPSKVAIDAPLGWPTDFVRGLADPDRWPVGIDGDRSRLERRATDHWVHRMTGKLPLSVSTDRIAYAAMRAAGLIAHYSDATGHAVDRTGFTGTLCETYPDPAIRTLGLWPEQFGKRDSYKGDATHVREAIVATLQRQAPWLVMQPEHAAACVDSDDCLDALICALVARATEMDCSEPVPGEYLSEAMSEGWIHLPVADALQRLLG